MQHFIDQAQRNEELHVILSTNHPDKFFNWKIMAIYYAAFHFLKALASKKNIEIGDTQYAIDKSCNPESNATIMPIQREAWHHYIELQRQFSASSYNSPAGSYMSDDLRRIHGRCIEHLHSFKKYIVKELFG